jgi:hypothetical protein
MGDAFINQKKSSGIKLNDIIEDFKYVYKNQKIKAGDFVNFINGVSGDYDYYTSTNVNLKSDTNASNCVSAVALDDHRVFVAHGLGTTSSSYLYGIVCIIENSTITVATKYTISTTSYTGVNLSAIKLDDDTVFVAHTRSSSLILTGVVCKVTNTTISSGTNTQIDGSASAGKQMSLVNLGENRIFIPHCYYSQYYLYGVVCTISGTTITKGSNILLNNSVNNTGYSIASCMLYSNKVFIAHSYGTDYQTYGMICTISGTTISIVSDVKLGSNNYNAYGLKVLRLDSRRVIVFKCVDSSKYLMASVAVIENDSASFPETTRLIINLSNQTGSVFSVNLLPNGEVIVFYNSDSSSHKLKGIIVTINGTVLTKNTDVYLKSDNGTGYGISSVLLNNGSLFTTFSNSSNYLDAQIFGIDYENKIPTNQVAIPIYEQQVTPTIEPPFDAIALSSGKNSPSELIEGEVTETGNNEFYKLWTSVSDTECSASDGSTMTISKVPSQFSGNGLVSVCDNNTETFYYTSISGNSADKNVDLLISLAEPIKISRMKVAFNYRISYFVKLDILGSKDSSTWTKLRTLTTLNNDLFVDCFLTNVDNYKYYKLSFDLSATPSSTNVGFFLYEVQASGYSVFGLAPRKDLIKIAKLSTANEVIKTGNIFPTSDWTSISGTYQYTSNGYTITPSDIDVYHAYNAFDGDTSTFWRASNDSSTKILKIELPKPVKITKMLLYIVVPVLDCIKIQGSNNDSDWVDLKTLYSDLEELALVTLDNPDFYKYYRVLSIPPSNSGATSSTQIREWQTFEYVEVTE